jgi:S-adenosylmethionine hydrolase
MSEAVRKVRQALKRRSVVLSGFLACFCIFIPAHMEAEGPLVLQSDFGIEDASVAAMKGIAAKVSGSLNVHDLTHEIPQFNIWEAANRLKEAASFWPAGTVFVSVVDPGVGSGERSVVLKTRSGHYFVTPDNGTLTFVAEQLGIEELRQIDLSDNRVTGSSEFSTFHGRDLYAHVGANLASGHMFFQQVGRRLPPEIVELKHVKCNVSDGVAHGSIPVLDKRFGNVWTNIPLKLFGKLGIAAGEPVSVKISRRGTVIFEHTMVFSRSFSEVPVGDPLVFVNNLGEIALATNRGNFAETHGIEAGTEWSVEMSSAEE